MSTGRFAPSPTGVLHLGNLRTAVLAWLFARSAGSRFLMRIEDLDVGRVRPEYAAEQLSPELCGVVGRRWVHTRQVRFFERHMFTRTAHP